MAGRKRDQRVKVHLGKSGNFGYASWPEVHEYFRQKAAKIVCQSPFEIELTEQAAQGFMADWTQVSDGHVMNGSLMRR